MFLLFSSYVCYLALGLSEANAPYPIFISFFNESFKFMCLYW